MTTTTTLPRRHAALRAPRSVPAFISFARAVVQSMTGNARFPAPLPPLADVTTAITELEDAQSASLARTKGTVAVRDDKRSALLVLLQQLEATVQNAADADRENAAAIIESTGMSVSRTPTRAARALAATSAGVSGTVKIELPTVARRAAYEWQYSLDGGKTWLLGPVTLQAKTTVSGLQPGVSAMFRVRPVTKAGQGDWSEPVSIIVR